MSWSTVCRDSGETEDLPKEAIGFLYVDQFREVFLNLRKDGTNTLEIAFRHRSAVQDVFG
jgi:hypothetical protein